MSITARAFHHESPGEGPRGGAAAPAVLWDVDGTLLDFAAAERAAMRSCFAVFGLGECTDAMIEEYSRVNVRYWQALERGEMTRQEILVGRFREFFASQGIDLAAAEPFNEEYQLRLGDTAVFCPGALETVRALRGRALQCAVTNGTKTAQRRKLSRSGLDVLLDHVFISEDIGAEKPSPAFFDAVFAVIGEELRPRSLVVGDSLTSDVLGGRGAGLRTAWYDPAGRGSAGDVTPDWRIRSLTQVPALLEQL